MKVFKIAIILGLLIWFTLSVRFVESNAGQIVSTEKVSIDSTITEINIVSPDEIERLEGDRDCEINQMKQDIEVLKRKVATLESQRNK